MGSREECGGIGETRDQALESLIPANRSIFGVSEVVDRHTDPENPAARHARDFALAYHP
jgi:hypothetical protein